MGKKDSAKLVVGSPAPDFVLPDQTGVDVRLYDLLGQKNVVLFFYPKDFTPTCTAESCGFRDDYQAFADAGAEVIGISSDSTKTHASFHKRNKLNYQLLSDRDGLVRKQFGVPRALAGFAPGRTTYVIDKAGIVRHVFSSFFTADDHIEEALAAVTKLSKAQAQHRSASAAGPV